MSDRLQINAFKWKLNHNCMQETVHACNSSLLKWIHSKFDLFFFFLSSSLRFLHYLDAIHLGLEKSTLQHLAEDFP